MAVIRRRGCAIHRSDASTSNEGLTADLTDVSQTFARAIARNRVTSGPRMEFVSRCLGDSVKRTRETKHTRESGLALGDRDC